MSWVRIPSLTPMKLQVRALLPINEPWLEAPSAGFGSGLGVDLRHAGLCKSLALRSQQPIERGHGGLWRDPRAFPQ
jgi:hypothetical protein